MHNPVFSPAISFVCMCVHISTSVLAYGREYTAHARVSHGVPYLL